MGKNYAAEDEVLYHVGLKRSDLEGATVAILPGDPGRVEFLAKNFGGEYKMIGAHREYTSALIKIDDQPVLIMSTGMGGPSVAIGLEELARLGITHVIRFGTTGTIQEHINLGDVIITNAAVRLDGTSGHYAPIEFPAVADFEVTRALVDAAKAVNADFNVGITISSDTFWPGQERYDSFTGYVPRRFQGSMKEWQALGALNYEMEASALYVASQVMGLKAGTVCGVVAKRTESESVAPSWAYEKAFSQMIDITRGAISTILAAEK